MSKLMLGGGVETPRYQRVGWTVLDGDERVAPDHVAIVPPVPEQIIAEEWDVVCAYHFIEHLFLDDAKILLKTVHSILKPGGKLILEQANLTWVCRAILGQVQLPVNRYPWMNGDASWLTLRSLYPQPDQMSENDLNIHRFGYTPESLTALVVSCGWTPDHVRTMRPQTHVTERDFRLEAMKDKA